MSSPFYSLKALKARVESLIEEQGEDSQCAAWIYTSEDIVKYDDDGNEVYPPQSLCNSVLCNLQDYDNIHTTIYDSIESELAWLGRNI